MYALKCHQHDIWSHKQRKAVRSFGINKWHQFEVLRVKSTRISTFFSMLLGHFLGVLYKLSGGRCQFLNDEHTCSFHTARWSLSQFFRRIDILSACRHVFVEYWSVEVNRQHGDAVRKRLFTTIPKKNAFLKETKYHDFIIIKTPHYASRYDVVRCARKWFFHDTYFVSRHKKKGSSERLIEDAFSFDTLEFCHWRVQSFQLSVSNERP